MLRFKWQHLTIETNEDAEQMRQLFKSTSPYIAGFDTEGNGLNIVRCQPFLFQFGWVDTETMQGYTFAVDLELHPQLARQVIKVWHALVKNLWKYFAHNVKFDLNMLCNIGMPYTEPNVSDTMSWIRAGTDAVSERDGGASLKLKDFAVRYIDAQAKDHEHTIKAERTKIAKDLNLKLQKRLGWRKKDIDAFFNDALNEACDLPSTLLQAYNAWHSEDLPEYLKPIVTGAVDSDMIAYNTLNRKEVTMYGHFDIVWLLEAAYLLIKTAAARENMTGITLDEANIYPVLEMERTGFRVDKPYLYEAKANVKKYIRERREDLQRVAGMELSIGQHAAIKEILCSMGIQVASTGKDELDILLPRLKRQGDAEVAVEFIETLQELRTLEKWYSTYIMRFMTEMNYGDMLYTQINLSGAISGRVTSDFQQFPKGAIKTIGGDVLFEPRRLFIVPEGYQAIVYLDYSQIELRLQAMYTLLVGKGDLNLCRAYMPFKCYSTDNTGKIPFDYTNLTHLQCAYTWEWYRDEDGTVWKPTDVHGATTKIAFGIDETDEHFHDLRYIGKRVNFAKNYGAQRGKIAQMFPEYDEAVVTAIDGAYYKAFPGVKDYHEYCYALMRTNAYGQNLYGRRYYNASGHNIINLLIQGTGADVLKTKNVAIYQYLKDKGYKSKWQMQIHDENSFLYHPDDPLELFFEIKAIMEDFTDFLVPIVAEMEVTTTTWADKKGVRTIEELEDKIRTGH